MDSERVMLVDHNGNPLITQAFQFDDTDKLAVSVWGKETIAGDKELSLDSSGYPSFSCQGYVSSMQSQSARSGYNPATDGVSVYAQGAIDWLYNGSTLDAKRNNNEITLLDSSAYTSTQISPDQTNYNARGVMIYFDVTAVPGGDTVTLYLQSKDPISGTYDTMMQSDAIVGVSYWSMMLYPGAVDTNGRLERVQGLALPRTWYIAVSHSGAGEFTYSVGGSYIL